MAGFGVDTRPAAAAAGEGALSFISRSLREDLRLIRARAGELETFLSAPVPEPDLFARLRRAYTTSSSSPGSTRLDLSAIGKAFEAEVGRGWGAKAKAGWKWEEEEDAGVWDPIRAVKARLRDLDRRRQDQASDVLHKVKLSLVCLLTHSPD
jgi:digalactosyldiacylglycerol synthase